MIQTARFVWSLLAVTLLVDNKIDSDLHQPVHSLVDTFAVNH
jgi:hypothetical protein